jgi:hypothetical protein
MTMSLFLLFFQCVPFAGAVVAEDAVDDLARELEPRASTLDSEAWDANVYAPALQLAREIIPQTSCCAHAPQPVCDTAVTP